MFGIGMPELIIILVIMLIIFGAGKLPEIGAGLGKGIKGFKKAVNNEDEIDITPPKEEVTDDNKPDTKAETGSSGKEEVKKEEA
ncbi:MAG: twin-arginine translocase TatA/TatE family subunit [bacterium]|nr:twin-arginine translocase TatA/TatE family subunit [bacterium]